MAVTTSTDYLTWADQLISTNTALLASCWETRTHRHPPVIRFDRPGATLPISLTGTGCALRCAHCNGIYLRHMHRLEDAAVSACRSALISGGCDTSGRVPVTDKQLEQIACLKSAGIRLNWHLGFIDEASLTRLTPYIDMVSFDIVGDTETAREVYGLDTSLAECLRTLDMLREHVPVVPHLTIGLRAGRLSGEQAVLDALTARDIPALVLLILIPTSGTAFAECALPALGDVLSVFTAARLSLPGAVLYLGCMRPKGAYRQACDALAVRSGLNVIVNPDRTAVSLAKELGLKIVYGDECCALTL